MGIKVEQTVYEPIPTGKYTAVIEKIEESEGQFGPQLKFEFVVEGGEHEGMSIFGWASKKFRSSSKLYKWTRAARGNVDIPRDYTFDSDDLLNRKVLLTVVINSKDDGSEFNRVEALRPIKKKGTDDIPSPLLIEDEDIPF